MFLASPLWRRMSGGTIFLFGFGKCLWRQSYCLLGSRFVRPKSVRPWACSSYVIGLNFIDYNRSKSVKDEFDKLKLTRYHTMPHFDALKTYSYGKAEKQKLLVTSNFSFSQNVFYPIWHLFFILNAL